MAVAASLRTGLARRGWPITRDPGRVAAYVLCVDAVAVVWSVLALANLHDTLGRWGVLGLLVGLAVAFEECARHTGRLHFRMSHELKRDMTSVWSVAAAVALSPGLAVILHVVVLGYLWVRQQRPAGEIFYRKFCSSCAALLGCLVAQSARHAAHPLWAHTPAVVGGAIAVVVVIVVHACVDRALITGALLMLGTRGRALAGSRDDNFIELATLCLGGLVAVTAQDQPLLCVLVFLPLLALQRGALIHEVEEAATTDPKTGLLNAVAWEHVAQAELARGRREDQPVAVLLIDIDRFKLVNDRYGHLAGDDVLRAIGRCLREAVREYDTVGRFGGEEFVAVLPAADDAAALVVAERLRAAVYRLRVSDVVAGMAAPGEGQPDDRLAVSVGVSSTPRDGDDLTELLHAADEALYGAKADGRNRVMLARRDGRGERMPASG